MKLGEQKLNVYSVLSYQELVIDHSLILDIKNID